MIAFMPLIAGVGKAITGGAARAAGVSAGGSLLGTAAKAAGGAILRNMFGKQGEAEGAGTPGSSLLQGAGATLKNLEANRSQSTAASTSINVNDTTGLRETKFEALKLQRDDFFKLLGAVNEDLIAKINIVNKNVWTSHSFTLKLLKNQAEAINQVASKVNTAESHFKELSQKLSKIIQGHESAKYQERGQARAGQGGSEEKEGYPGLKELTSSVLGAAALIAAPNIRSYLDKKGQEDQARQGVSRLPDQVDQTGKPIDPKVVANATEIAQKHGASGLRQYFASKGYNVSDSWCGQLATALLVESGGTPWKGSAIATTWLDKGSHVAMWKDKEALANLKPGDFGSSRVGTYGSKKGQTLSMGETGGHVMTVAQPPGGGSPYDPKTNRVYVVDTMGARWHPVTNYEFRRLTNQEGGPAQAGAPVGSAPGERGPVGKFDPTIGSRNNFINVPNDGRFASERYNNPGAQYPSKDAEKFGMTGYGIIGGGHKIAHFPTTAHGLAANMSNFRINYAGLTIQQAVSKWRGGNGNLSVPPGFNPNQRITAEMTNDPTFMKEFFKGMAANEGRRTPITATEYDKAFEMYTAGGKFPGPDLTKSADRLTGQQDDQKSAPKSFLAGLPIPSISSISDFAEDSSKSIKDYFSKLKENLSKGPTPIADWLLGPIVDKTKDLISSSEATPASATPSVATPSVATGKSAEDAIDDIIKAGYKRSRGVSEGAMQAREDALSVRNAKESSDAGAGFDAGNSDAWFNQKMRVDKSIRPPSEGALEAQAEAVEIRKQKAIDDAFAVASSNAGAGFESPGNGADVIDDIIKAGYKKGRGVSEGAMQASEDAIQIRNAKESSDAGAGFDAGNSDAWFNQKMRVDKSIRPISEGAMQAQADAVLVMNQKEREALGANESSAMGADIIPPNVYTPDLIPKQSPRWPEATADKPGSPDNSDAGNESAGGGGYSAKSANPNWGKKAGDGHGPSKYHPEQQDARPGDQGMGQVTNPDGIGLCTI